MIDSRDLDPGPKQLVTGGAQRFGRFGTHVGRANLIDARFRGFPRALRKWRLKEWQALQITGDGLFANFALFDAKILSLLQAKIYDRERGEKAVHEWKLRPGALSLADQLVDSTNAYQDRRGGLRFENDLAHGRIKVAIDLAGTDKLPRIQGELEVHCDLGASQVVSLPFEGSGGMYSHKGMFPIEGGLSVGQRTHRFRKEDSLALLDDHKGYYPYVMRWDWVTSAAFVDGRALGFNLTHNQCEDPETHNENCAWQGGRLGVLPAVEFTYEKPRTSEERWRIRDREGRVDLTFTPTVPGDVRVNALVVESRYRGPFGIFSGRLEPQGLHPIVIQNWFGMGEDFYLRC